MSEKMTVVSLVMIVFIIWIIYSNLGDFYLREKRTNIRQTFMTIG